MVDDGLLELMAAHMRMPFPPECRGRDIDGVELVLVDADVYGVATWYDDNDAPLSAEHAALLVRLVSDLDRIMPKLLNEEAEAYYRVVRDLGAYLLANRRPSPD